MAKTQRPETSVQEAARLNATAYAARRKCYKLFKQTSGGHDDVDIDWQEEAGGEGEFVLDQSGRDIYLTIPVAIKLARHILKVTANAE